MTETGATRFSGRRIPMTTPRTRCAIARPEVSRCALRIQRSKDCPGCWALLGLRGERRTTHYDDVTTNLDAPTVYQTFDPEDNLWGGDASLDYTIGQGQHLYALIARGYKAAGFNLSPGLPANQVLFGPE